MIGSSKKAVFGPRISETADKKTANKEGRLYLFCVSAKKMINCFFTLISAFVDDESELFENFEQQNSRRKRKINDHLPRL